MLELSALSSQVGMEVNFVGFPRGLRVTPEITEISEISQMMSSEKVVVTVGGLYYAWFLGMIRSPNHEHLVKKSKYYF